MTSQKPKSYPMLPVGHWWTLREKFKQSIPGVVTDNYVATALNMQPRSARGNVLPYLKDFGLIDEEGKTQQDMAKAWRDDEQYADACRRIRERIYPEELMAAVPNPEGNRSALERWFANRTGAGAGAIGRMSAIYTVISQADASKRPHGKRQKEATALEAKEQRRIQKKPRPASSLREAGGPVLAGDLPARAPGVSINLEIHISSDATPDQIDKIFESMARHIYKK